MSRIEYDCCEQKMEDLRGYCKSYFADEKNPYTTDKLHDDDFNFVSGMNFVLSHVTDLFIANIGDYVDDDNPVLAELKKSIAKKAIEDFAEFGYSDLAEHLTSLLESAEYDDDFAEEDE